MKTFVLVPGAWLGGWVWKKITPLLVKSGYETHSVTLTGMGERSHLASRELGIDTAIMDVINVIEYNGLDDVLLVGHSFAGKVIAAVADRIPDRINTLLFLDASRPKKVRTPQGGMGDWPKKDQDEVMEECRKNGEGWKFPLTDETLKQTGQDVLGEDRQWMLSKITPLPVRLFQDSITLSANYDSIRKAYVFCTRGGDDIEEIKRESLDGPSRIIDSGHWPMITKPLELADALLSLAS
jgi:pimeloyl-ACP methyl ester carboxylesterase